ncbi:helix-turn-helix domain-containing protein [Streptomyces sp. MAR4 CNX-425]|uniref:helix-turn-helix domain-containing protein n=1 Tax=Streptomyces sp. MAR4 CNX-425 TaxID=3406343 RepID=UPI003B50203E
MTNDAPHHQARILPLRPPAPADGDGREPLWRQVVGGVLRRERLAQERTLKDVADAARISMPYLSEVERGLKEASSEVLGAAAQALGLRLADLLVLVHGEIVRLSAVRDGEQAAAERRRRAAGSLTSTVSSVTELPSARPGPGTRSRPGASSRPGDVRLAA